MILGQFEFWPGEEKTLAVRLEGEGVVFTNWFGSFSPPNLSLQPSSVSFPTLDDGREGFVSGELSVLPEFKLGEDAVLAIRVPFVVQAGHTVLVGALVDNEDCCFSVPAGSHILYYETGFLHPPLEDDGVNESELSEEPTMWCRLTFVCHAQQAEPVILRTLEPG